MAEFLALWVGSAPSRNVHKIYNSVGFTRDDAHRPDEDPLLYRGWPVNGTFVLEPSFG